MRNLRLTIAYEGTSYFGWQIQPDRPTIQGEIQAAFRSLTGESVCANCAGRTDAGVHALGQVANIRTETNLAVERILLGMQHFLPEAIAVRDVADVPLDFHATLSARRKTYRYVLHCSRIRDPFMRRYSWRINQELITATMGEAAAVLVGRHDFQVFETQGSPRADTIRTLFDVRVQQCPSWNPMSPSDQPAVDGTGPLVVIEVTGDGFLYNMVRAITGTLVEVGLGKRTPRDIEKLLASGRRADAGQTAPPQGLFLVSVNYPGDTVAATINTR